MNTTSITTSSYNYLSQTGELIKPINNNSLNLNVSSLAVLLLLLSIAPSISQTTRNIEHGDINVQQLSSVNQSDILKEKLKEQEFSFITAMGLDDNDVTYRDI